MAHVSIDEDHDYANDQRRVRHADQHINEQPLDYADDERSRRRLRRNSAKIKYQQSCHNKKGKNEQADDSYTFFLNFYVSKDEESRFQDIDHTNSDADLQYGKFLSLLKPYKNSYVLDFVKADGSYQSITYEDDDMTSDQPNHNTCQNATYTQEKNGLLHHISGNMLDSRNSKGFKSSNEPSETLGRSDKMDAENDGHPSLKESLIVGPEFTSLKPMITDSQRRSIDVSYHFYLIQKLNRKDEEKLNCPQDSKKQNICSAAANVTKETPRKHTLDPHVHSGHMFDGKQGKKPRLSQDSGKGVNTAMDAKVTQDAYGDKEFGMTDHLRKKLESKHGGKTRHCRNLGNSRQKTIRDKAIERDIGMQASNDKQRKRHRLAEDYENCGRRNGTAVPVRETPNDKLVKNQRLSGYSERATKRTLADSVAEDANDLHALHANQSSGKKSCPKNHNQSESKLKFDGLVNDSYKAFLSGLSEIGGHPVFQSEEGKVVTHEPDLKKSSTDSDSDSDSVIIIGDSENGITDHKYSSFAPRILFFKDLELDKSRTDKVTSFRKKLMNILLKPYDQKEYESLMEKAEKRSPLEGYRDLRRGRGGRRGTYELESLGKSYLDHHKDVGKAIEECRGDCQKVLIILRGFMFWLEHIAHDGAFKPWKDKECLEVQSRRSSLRKGIKSEAY